MPFPGASIIDFEQVNVSWVLTYISHTLKVTQDSISCYCILQEKYQMRNQLTALQEHLLQKLLTLEP